MSDDAAVTPVFFLSDSTGISAETMGNAMLIQFPDLRFERQLIPFITTVEEAERVVAILDEAADGPVTPHRLHDGRDRRDPRGPAPHPVPDDRLLRAAHAAGWRRSSASPRRGSRPGCTAWVTSSATTRGWRPSSTRSSTTTVRACAPSSKADIVLVAPSRCGKTPTTMYLALQHGLFVANYPLVEEDLESTELPGPIRAPRRPVRRHGRHPGAALARCATSAAPGSRYASLEQCTYELRRAEALYRANGMPVINSTTRSVEEMATPILQTLRSRSHQSHPSHGTEGVPHDRPSGATSAGSRPSAWGTSSRWGARTPRSGR